MYNIIIKPAHKQIYPTRLAGGTYYHLEAAKHQHTEATSSVNKSISCHYNSLVSLNNALGSFTVSLSALHESLGSLHDSTGALHKPTGCPITFYDEGFDKLSLTNSRIKKLSFRVNRRIDNFLSFEIA